MDKKFGIAGITIASNVLLRGDDHGFQGKIMDYYNLWAKNICPIMNEQCIIGVVEAIRSIVWIVGLCQHLEI